MVAGPALCWGAAGLVELGREVPWQRACADWPRRCAGKSRPSTPPCTPGPIAPCWPRRCPRRPRPVPGPRPGPRHGRWPAVSTSQRRLCRRGRLAGQASRARTRAEARADLGTASLWPAAGHGRRPGQRRAVHETGGRGGQGRVCMSPVAKQDSAGPGPVLGPGGVARRGPQDVLRSHPRRTGRPPAPPPATCATGATSSAWCAWPVPCPPPWA